MTDCTQNSSLSLPWVCWNNSSVPSSCEEHSQGILRGEEEEEAALLAQPLHHFPLPVWREWEFSKHLHAGETTGPKSLSDPCSLPTPPLPVGVWFLQDLQDLLFALHCLNLLQGSPGDVKQSCSSAVKICKHGQIWGLVWRASKSGHTQSGTTPQSWGD